MSLKIKPEHLQHLKTELERVLSEKSAVTQAYRDADHSHMRYRWDILRAAVGSKWICDTLYPYMNDDHIDSALRSILGADWK